MAERVKTNIQEVIKTLSVLKSHNELVEVRMYDSQKRITSGYFKDDYTKLLKGLENIDYENCYFVLNAIKDDCYSRVQRDKFEKFAKTTTSDTDIDYRQWLLIDTDPIRASGTSASNEEKQYARRTAANIYNYLRDIGFAYPIVADSGNGYHLLYKINIVNHAEPTEIIKNFLYALNILFTDDKVSVDTSVYNASRITKLYGTVARKGADTEERPHRLSKIIKVPDEPIKITDIELIKKVSDTLPKSPEENKNYQNYGSQFNAEEFARKYLKVSKTVNTQLGTKYLLESCPFNENHKSPDSMIFIYHNGAVSFKCLHNSCSNKKWQDVRELHESKRQQPKDSARSIKPNISAINSESAETKNTPQLKQYLQLHEIENSDRSKIISIPTGINVIDRKMIGFNKKEVTVMSGNNGSAKSTILGQFMLNSIQSGFKCALYSGEMNSERIKYWLHLQAAGRQYTKLSNYGENVYFTPEHIGKQIDEWAKGKLFIHNNKIGKKFSDVLKTIDETVKKEHSDIIFIDNLMAIDLSEVMGEEYQKQTNVIIKMTDIAKEYDIHIVFVCHPRKATGFLRKIDISGTADLTNAVDNVIMCHRINKDFEDNAKDFFGQEKINGFLKYQFTNCLEIMKNRDLGIQDELVGLYFEHESKRLLNDRNENVNYGWNIKSNPYDGKTKDFQEINDTDDLPIM